MDLEVERGFSDLHEQQREFSATYPPDMDVTVEKNLMKFHNGALFDKEPIIQLIYPTHDYTIVVFCVILAFGVFSNLYLLVRCLRPAKAHWRKARVYLLHVVVANLFICVFAIPVEIGWRWTIEWRGGNVGCKMLQFARVFGLYALAHILMAVAVDKVIEVRQLMKGDSAANSTKYVFAASWILTTLCSFPQVSLPILNFDGQNE
jgi:gonadotropin-releasing hormone receptor